jgi:hypothetical protein
VEIIVRAIAVHQSQCLLQLVDASTPDAGVHHQAEHAVGRQHRQQGAQARVRIGQVMQHAAAVDVVEWREPEHRQVEQRAVQPLDVVQATLLRALLRDRQARLAEVQMHDLGIGVAQLLGQEDRAVARAASGNQYPKALPERLPSGKPVMVDHRQRIEPGADQPLAFVGRIARRIGQCLVLGAYLRQVRGV